MSALNWFNTSCWSAATAARGVEDAVSSVAKPSVHVERPSFRRLEDRAAFAHRQQHGMEVLEGGAPW